MKEIRDLLEYPKGSVGRIMTTVTDIVGFFAFLGFAVLCQSYLL